jgi:hypothetical protein
MNKLYYLIGFHCVKIILQNWNRRRCITFNIHSYFTLIPCEVTHCQEILDFFGLNFVYRIASWCVNSTIQERLKFYISMILSFFQFRSKWKRPNVVSIKSLSLTQIQLVVRWKSIALHGKPIQWKDLACKLFIKNPKIKFQIKWEVTNSKQQKLKHVQFHLTVVETTDLWNYWFDNSKIVFRSVSKKHGINPID